MEPIATQKNFNSVLREARQNLGLMPSSSRTLRMKYQQQKATCHDWVLISKAKPQLEQGVASDEAIKNHCLTRVGNPIKAMMLLCQTKV